MIVPDLFGLNEMEAFEMLPRGLQLSATITHTHNRPEGIIAQDQAVGTDVPHGTAIRVTINLLTDWVQMPKITGLQADDAEEALTLLGLSCDAADEVPRSFPLGEVVRQSPAPLTWVDVNHPPRISYEYSSGESMMTRRKRVHREQPAPPRPGFAKRLLEATGL